MNRTIAVRLIGLVLFLATASCAVKEIQPSTPTQPPPVVQPLPRAARIGLVLGAGAARGFAHVGVIKILESNKIPIHLIVGTSVGSAVGSLYAYGYNAFDLQKLSFSVEQNELVDLAVFPDNGFIKGEKLESFINKMVKNTPLEKMKIPFFAVAAEVQTGEEVVFGKGNTGAAVRASCSIPGIFRPAKIAGKTYVDGGVVSPVAVDAARKMGADVVIAVDISGAAGRTPPENTPSNTVDTILQSFSIMYARLSALQVPHADVVIKPRVGHIGSSDFSKRHEAVLEGEKAALEALPNALKIVNALRQEGRLE
jgi:NTE family protein